jgi:hypothetical protein
MDKLDHQYKLDQNETADKPHAALSTSVDTEVSQ